MFNAQQFDKFLKAFTETMPHLLDNDAGKLEEFQQFWERSQQDVVEGK